MACDVGVSHGTRLCLKKAICRRPAPSIIGFVDLYRRLTFEIACFDLFANDGFARPLGDEPLFKQSLGSFLRKIRSRIGEP